jgi:hypothetical protein
MRKRTVRAVCVGLCCCTWWLLAALGMAAPRSEGIRLADIPAAAAEDAV